jgi:hypothetical protein
VFEYLEPVKIGPHILKYFCNPVVVGRHRVGGLKEGISEVNHTAGTGAGTGVCRTVMR